MDKVDLLYKKYDVLASAGDKVSEHESDYLDILDSVKGTPSEKRLASQFIARFFKSFPHLAEKAIDAQLDLCEDGDVAIRKQAIKDLPSFCKDSKEYVPKIADVLAQLLLTEDHTELLVIQHSLVTLVKLDARGTLGGVFSQVVAGEDLVRERAIKFLCTKLPSMGAEVLTKEVEEFLLQECCKVMQDVTGQEFTSLMQLLSGLKLAKTIPGQQALVDLVAEQADLGKPLGESGGAGDASSRPEALAKLVQCIRQALLYFSPYVSSAKFVAHLCQQVLPGQVAADEETLEILKLLAEMAPFASNLSAEDLQTCLKLVFDKLLELMPLPPAGEETENSSDQQHEPELQLSHVECLMYSFHQLAKRNPQFLTADESAERLRDFKLRLQYLARGVQGYIKKLRLALQGKKPAELKTDENKLKVAALKTTSNINVLIRDLFHVPPSFKSAITLSWKPAATNEKPASDNAQTVPSSGAKGEKRRITFPEDANKGAKRTPPTSKNERELYSPPGGKYSTKVQGFQAPANRGGGRGGFNKFRGGSRGWRGRIYP
ncbi:apoptosis inhibitor cassowary [Amblyomma americanum]